MVNAVISIATVPALSLLSHNAFSEAEETISQTPGTQMVPAAKSNKSDWNENAAFFFEFPISRFYLSSLSVCSHR